MSKYSAALDRRIQSGEAIGVTGKWFLEVMKKESLWSELSDLERSFLNDLWGKPAFKSNSASGTFFNSGKDILRAVNEQNRRRLLSFRRGRHSPVNDVRLEAEPSSDTDGQG
jgi:hypothetical protein